MDRRNQKRREPSARDYITREGVSLLQKELGELMKSLATIQAGQAQVERQRMQYLESQVRSLTDRLTRCVVVEGRARDCFGFGSQATLVDQYGEQTVYTIVAVDEANPAQGKVSGFSPVAKALKHASEGDTVEIQGRGPMKVLRIR